ncbi:AraC family transcriptional regulator [Nonomuraea rhodomycinica]|uniref:AraC family transcriptional regulator n=1 Tax=Nonomuraea rhodomycinica TaxID=1712872 RepID=A0A7Y6MCR5_9ACTN|nr:AraC family transcriptional regulator [Nonomuraea rhodomycinica]NUW41839.1 AraC family transcriptional regulator [Nonomuraea rhodomycinica]
MTGSPLKMTRGLLHFDDGSPAYARRYAHEGEEPVHTHSFVEIAVVVGGTAVHHSLSGRHELAAGDVVLLRPGVWHGYERCAGLDLYNCCVGTDLLRDELSWTREDALLGYLLWTGPHSLQRRGVLTAHLDGHDLALSVGYLEQLDRLRDGSIRRHRADVIGWLSLFLGLLSRTVGSVRDDDAAEAALTHPTVMRVVRMVEADLAREWTLGELAGTVGLSPAYLVRLFKSATGLPPMAYLARLRVETAADLLLRTDEPVTSIAQAVGWADQSYFARRFKGYYGLSATTYRTRFRTRVARPPG